MEIPSHCWDNYTNGDPNATNVSFSEESVSNISGPIDSELGNTAAEDFNCFNHLNTDQTMSFYQFERAVGGYSNCTVGLFGLIGNALAIIVLCRKDMIKNCFSQLLIGLVSFDSFHIIFAILESFRTCWEAYYPEALLSIFPWFHYPFYRITLVCSIYMMIAVAIERCYAVCFPHYYHNLTTQNFRALYYIVPALGSALLINIPRFFETEYVEEGEYKNCTLVTEYVIKPTPLRWSQRYIIIYVRWIWTFSTIIIPFAALLLLNGKILVGLKKVKHRLQTHNRSASRPRSVMVTANNGGETTQANDKNDRRMSEPHLRNVSPVEDPSPPTEQATPVNYRDGEEMEMKTLLPKREGEKGDKSPTSTITPKTPLQEHHVDFKVTSEIKHCNVKGNGNDDPRRSKGSFKDKLLYKRRNTMHKSAAEKSEANLAVILLSSVTMFLICHLPRLFNAIYEATTANQVFECDRMGYRGVPIWYLYFPSIVKFLQTFNASINFPIYYLMGTSFRKSFHQMIGRQQR